MGDTQIPEIGDILENEELWTGELYRQFRERCHELSIESPVAYLELARHAPALAERIAVTVEKPAYIYMDAYLAYGDAHRLNGQFADAEKMFTRAAEYADELPRLETLELSRYLAALRKDQNRFDDALVLINDVIATDRARGDLVNRTFLGHCFLVRAIIFHAMGSSDMSVVDLSTALHLIDLKEKPRLYYSAVHNLAVALVDCNDLEALSQGVTLLRKARSAVPFRGRHLAKFKLRWLEGVILAKLGSTRLAERRMLIARDGLFDLGAFYEAALVSLDLLRIYLVTGETHQVIHKMATETHELFSGLSCDEEAIGALLVLCQTTKQERLSNQVLRKVRETLVKLTKPAM